MNVNQRTLLELIGSSQFSTKTERQLDVSWDEIYKEATQQSVLGIIVPVVPKEIGSSEKWQQFSYRQMASYIRYCYAEDDLVQILKSFSVPFVILKGNSAAVNYMDPSRRAMGDIDFIVFGDAFDSVKDILEKNGFEVEMGSFKSPRHIGFVKNGVSFELHRKFSHEDIDIDEYVTDGLNHIRIGKIEDHEFPMLPKLANGLVLLDHMRNHLKSGLGLRQVVDWMMYVYRELDDEFWEKEFSRVAKEKKMDTLAIIATRMCQIYMGLPETITWCKDADEELCEQLMENLLSSGNFGRKQGSGNSVEFVSTHMKSQGTFRWLQRMGEYNWEAYRKHHWLKPFCWIYQGIRYMKKGFKTGRNRKQLSDDLNRSEQRYELLKKLGIE